MGTTLLKDFHQQRAKGSDLSQTGAEGVIIPIEANKRIRVSIIRALIPPSVLILSRLKPSQTGVDARSDRNMLVHLNMDASLSIGSEWITGLRIQDFAG